MRRFLTVLVVLISVQGTPCSGQGREQPSEGAVAVYDAQEARAEKCSKIVSASLQRGVLDLDCDMRNCKPGSRCHSMALYPLKGAIVALQQKKAAEEAERERRLREYRARVEREKAQKRREPRKTPLKSETRSFTSIQGGRSYNVVYYHNVERKTISLKRVILEVRKNGEWEFHSSCSGHSECKSHFPYASDATRAHIRRLR